MAAPRPAAPAEPLLLTPGPLTTSQGVKRAMLRDLGSRDGTFIALSTGLRRRLTALANAAATHTCIPLQGSGTFLVEAALGTLIPRAGKALVLANGAYGRRMARILEILGRPHAVLEGPEEAPTDVPALARALAADPKIGHVLAVYCETTSGARNPVEAIADTVAAAGRRLILDAMSAFGALPLDARTLPFEAVVASANKCLEGVPGVGFAIVARDAIAAAKGNAHSLALDLHDQWAAIENGGQWRFTPPTHVLAALGQALDELEAEGGPPGRLARYAANCRALIAGMRALGFVPLLAPAHQAPIIVTFQMPRDPAFRFEAFYDGLAERGFVIYPGKLTRAPSFRMGCIGHLTPGDLEAAVEAAADTLRAMGVADGRPG